MTEAEEHWLLDTCRALNEPSRGSANLNWEVVREIRARSPAGSPQQELVRTFRSAWETVLLLANDIEPTRPARGQRPSNRKALAQINLHWHDLRHEALSRLADDAVPVHELQMLAGHASITTTQRYMNARAHSLAESMRQARLRRAARGHNRRRTDSGRVK